MRRVGEVGSHNPRALGDESVRHIRNTSAADLLGAGERAGEGVGLAHEFLSGGLRRNHTQQCDEKKTDIFFAKNHYRPKFSVANIYKNSHTKIKFQ